MNKRRFIEVFVCLLYLLVMANAAAKIPGSPARYEETFGYIFFSWLLLGFVSVMTFVARDFIFRISPYPITLLFGFALLLIDIKSAYAYEWDAFWTSLPYGIRWMFYGAIYLLLVEKVFPWIWAFLKRKQNSTGETIA